jgi:hypothetical protein
MVSNFEFFLREIRRFAQSDRDNSSLITLVVRCLFFGCWPVLSNNDQPGITNQIKRCNIDINLPSLQYRIMSMILRISHKILVYIPSGLNALPDF